MNYWKNPSLDLFGLRIDEPITAFTDIMVALVGFIAFYKTASAENQRSVSLYRMFFLFTAISTLIAAILGHAFAYYFGFNARFIGWIFGAFGVAFAQFAVIFNTKEIFNPVIFKGLVILNVIEIIAVTFLIFLEKSFIVIELHSAFGLVIMVTILETYNYYRTRSQLSRNMVYGVMLAIAAVICHITKLAISQWFNHLDISHLLMAASLYVMYKGVLSEQKLTPANA